MKVTLYYKGKMYESRNDMKRANKHFIDLVNIIRLNDFPDRNIALTLYIKSNIIIEHTFYTDTDTIYIDILDSYIRDLISLWERILIKESNVKESIILDRLRLVLSYRDILSKKGS